jgi:Xaa-Pro aminopeptidase
VDAYHAKVRDALSPLLTGEDLAWLEKATAAL